MSNETDYFLCKGKLLSKSKTKFTPFVIEDSICMVGLQWSRT